MKQAGSAILPITQLTNLLKESEVDEVSLDATADGTKVKAGTSRFELPARPVDESMKSAAVPTLLPEGWEYDQVFGELPQGSTESRLALALGMCLMSLGLALLRLRRA